MHCRWNTFSFALELSTYMSGIIQNSGRVCDRSIIWQWQKKLAKKVSRIILMTPRALNWSSGSNQFSHDENIRTKQMITSEQNTLEVKIVETLLKTKWVCYYFLKPGLRKARTKKIRMRRSKPLVQRGKYFWTTPKIQQYKDWFIYFSPTR